MTRCALWAVQGSDVTQVRVPSFDHPTSPEAGDRERREAAEFAVPPVSAFRHTVTCHAGRPAAAPENRPMHRILSLLSLLALAAAPRLLVAQAAISGTITDLYTAAPLAGVTLTVVGTTLGSATDSVGRYTVSNVAPGTHRLRARRLGYAPADTTVVVQQGEPTLVNLRLQPSPFELNPVVAIGYGEQAKGTLTGAVSAVSGKEVQSIPANNLSNTLSGQLPGLVTVNPSGEPGYDGAIIRIRGSHTLNDNSALVVIDGVPDRDGGL